MCQVKKKEKIEQISLHPQQVLNPSFIGRGCGRTGLIFNIQKKEKPLSDLIIPCSLF